MATNSDGPRRCAWAGSDLLMAAYHDHEWGVPCHDDRQLFERLVLEGFQAGLSWSTILRKREAFIRAFDWFDPAVVAAYDVDDIARLMADPGIVRNRLKIESAITNAQAFLSTRAEFGSFDAYIWQFAPRGTRARPRTHADIPATTAESDAMSKALKQRGFRFVGSTICYAFMQSVGLVDDHTADCFRASG
ncbi:MAG: DNA-3-methyladenine glycosylase I [Thermomicrobiales bacterium]|nr:DNA-3-methyladenine glycosylase I [Thermomicrobiales bacterium]